MRYLTGSDILVLHARIMEETGGIHGVRDVGLLSSIVERPKMRFGGRELYRGVFQKAAVYVQSLAQYHVFVDGNKRTAVAASARFLYLNGYEMTATNIEVEQFVLRVVTKKLALESISEWLRIHSRRLTK
ncbi:type II toxin-antitoxin system death-on-curing family toxin [Candidatus Azambacteria bacterium]|nr:type II toxin-antitoxin system death-on-curing family toxin [Candidatus Azambacteria bacterium]